MSRLGRYRTLASKALTRPPQQVARRVAREIGIQAARPWVRIRPSLLSDHTVLQGVGCSDLASLPAALARAPFFPMSGEPLAVVAAPFRMTFPGSVQAVVAEADRCCAHEFDLLGSGPRRLGTTLPWRQDFKTGACWPRAYIADLEYQSPVHESDVKVPWELSRFQHAVTLGQAWLFTGDERYRSEFVAQVDDFTRDNPWGYSVNWLCAMDVAIRAHNLQWGYHYCFGPGSEASPAIALRFARALYLHGEFIERHLEISDVNGNHYLADAVGLVSVAALFRHSRAGERWFQLGRRMLREEILSQVHPDGVDFEQSIAYHRFVTEMFLTGFLILRRAGEDPEPVAWDRLSRMFDYIAAYTKPDGRAPLVGDADDGRMQKLAPRDVNDHRYLLSTGACLFDRPTLAAAAGRCWEETWWMLGSGAQERFDRLPPAASPQSQAFAEGGVYVLRAPGAHAIVDCAEVGMRGLGGHGHNDILSFELVLGGVAVVTDCGAFVYTADAVARDRFRATAAHNGVQVDEEEVNRFFSPTDLWRLRNDARPLDVVWRPRGMGGVVAAAHTGYERLHDPVRHRRTCAMSEDGSLFAIEDALQAAGRHRYTWRFHLEPGATAMHDGQDATILSNGRTILIVSVAPSDLVLSLEDGWVSPSYGVRARDTVVRADLECAGSVVIQWMFATGGGRSGIVDRGRRLLEER